jgi:hypothetical protein
MNLKIAFLLFPFACLFSIGCSTAETLPPQNVPQDMVKAPELPAPAPTPGDSPSKLTYGMIKGRVEKGKTTQDEILELFGGPDTMTTDRDGTEVWMYDKTTSTVTGSQAVSSAQAEKSEAGTMAAFFGIPFVTGVGGAKGNTASESARVAQASNTVTRSSKTITFIVKFNDNKTVKDYAVRQSKY